MCSRTFCPDCGGEFIHRDHRRHWESASTLGQIIHHLKRSFTYVDIDGCTYKRTKRLLRLVEHKQPHQMVKYAQGEVLELLDRIIAHYVECPTAQDVEKLHPDSGVYLMTGELDAADEGHRECQLAGPQVITNKRLGNVTITDATALYEWLEGWLSPQREQESA